MNQFFIHCLLLAEGARSEQFVKGFREGNLHRAANINALLIAAAALAIAVAFYVAERFRRSRQGGPVCNHRRLFLDLCRLHHLGWTSRRLLERLARDARLSSAAQMFVRPDLFESLDALSTGQREHAAQLKQKLFASEPEPRPAPA